MGQVEGKIEESSVLKNGRKIVVSVVELDRELARVLPAGFVNAYLAVYLKALGATQRPSDDVGVASGGSSGPRTSTGQTETRGGAKSGKKLAGAANKQTIKDERALAEKSRIDRKLRALAREMMVWMREGDGARLSVRKCVRCNKYGENTWSFCPYDGAMMEEVN